MQLTKQLEAEIRLFLADYWNTYMKGDLQTFASYIIDDYKNIGGTQQEIFNNKKEMMDYTKAVIHQMVGNIEIRNMQTQIFSLGPFFMAHEFCDLYIKMEAEWVFYGKFRVSSIIQKIDNKWKVIHQHGSYPDAKAEEGETFAFDKISTENRELKDAIKRRTVELENKTRELEIEASLERVRAVAMGMKKPDDLLSICEILFKELQAAGFSELRNTLIHTFVDEKNYFLDYDFSDFTGGCISRIPYTGHLFIEKFIKEIRNTKDAFTEIAIIAKELEEWKEFRKIYGEADDPRLDNTPALYYYIYAIGIGSIGISTFQSITQEKLEILKRFRNVFDFAYRRYIDIEQAVAQTKEAQIEASLERMRAVAMSIRKSEELILVAESLYKELRTLGFANIRNAQLVIKIEGDGMYLVCIYSDDTAEILKEYRYDTSPIIQQLYNELDTSRDALYQKEITGRDFEEWLNWRRSTTTIIDRRLLEAGSVSFYLYSIGEGHLGISAYNAITNEQLEVLKRFRNVFELSYRRFMDIAKSEEQALRLQQEKERLEQTLRELQDAQNQLIQSEKMASLGELTAGIAHEIQNPLNFVNNFSDVSTELVDEMNAEIDKGNFKDAKQIAQDLIQNLKKINHHGKRAGDIVKGMLQHSRSSSGVKEPTDINALADEYLRLAYHGQRAKDKSFYATLRTDYDETIGNINIIPQDIGRVILNLITNAFYAVTERNASTSSAGQQYEPTVSVSTKKINGKIEIKVKDNGNGIPQKVLDKVFQPFFTTKPTGQGTGLGLSLAYDIVKAHGSEIKVVTKEGDGTEFNIQLPV